MLPLIYRPLPLLPPPIKTLPCHNESPCLTVNMWEPLRHGREVWPTGVKPRRPVSDRYDMYEYMSTVVLPYYFIRRCLKTSSMGALRSERLYHVEITPPPPAINPSLKQENRLDYGRVCFFNSNFLAKCFVGITFH